MTISHDRDEMPALRLLKRAFKEANDLLHSTPCHLVHSAPNETTA